MNRLSPVIVGICVGVMLGACGIGSVGSGSIHPACHAHPDPGDCDAALAAATSELDLDRYNVIVGMLDCEGGHCTTWVSAVPNTDDCLPLWEIEVTRPSIGTWSVITMTHGDPPCAFEP